MKKNETKRVLGRTVAKELTPAELKLVTGASWTYTAGIGRMDAGDASH